MSDRLRSALNNAIKVFVGGVLLIVVTGLGDAADWINGGTVPDLSTYTKAVTLLAITAVSAVVSAVIDWLKTFDWFPGQAPTYPPPPPEPPV